MLKGRNNIPNNNTTHKLTYFHYWIWLCHQTEYIWTIFAEIYTRHKDTDLNWHYKITQPALSITWMCYSFHSVFSSVYVCIGRNQTAGVFSPADTLWSFHSHCLRLLFCLDLISAMCQHLCAIYHPSVVFCWFCNIRSRLCFVFSVGLQASDKESGGTFPGGLFAGGARWLGSWHHRCSGETADRWEGGKPRRAGWVRVTQLQSEVKKPSLTYKLNLILFLPSLYSYLFLIVSGPLTARCWTPCMMFTVGSRWANTWSRAALTTTASQVSFETATLCFTVWAEKIIGYKDLHHL